MSLAESMGRNGRLQATLHRLQELDYDDSLVTRLGEIILTNEERALYRINPRFLAGQLSGEERTAMGLLIAATAERLFRLGWRVNCPACGGYGDVGGSLADVDSEAQCHICGHRFQTHLDDEITVHLTINERFRSISNQAKEDYAFRNEVDRRLGLVTAISLLQAPNFRKLIDDQVLPEGQSLGVKRLAVFFSDLRRSTAFYHKLGDAEAYHWVNEHFKVMFAAVEKHGGTAVKTIGDGVMGIFTSPSAALLGISEAMAGINRLNRQANLSGNDQLALKVGLHCGPCIVVTLNGRLDYFGETVNIAARLGGLSSGGDVIISQDVLDEEDVTELMATMGEVRPIAARLRGLPGHYDLHRILIK